MTTDLERKAHLLVELARSGDEPSAAQLLSLHGAVAARIAAEGASAASTTTVTAGSGKVAGAGAFVKGLVVAGAIATGAAGFFALREPSPAPVRVAPRPRAPVVTPRPVLEHPAPPEVTSSAQAEESPAPRSKPAPGLRLQDEAALLAEVQGALRAGNPKQALGKLEGYDRRFPSGMLRAEADAARVFALCASGRADKARTFAARFVQRYPGSPAAARVQAACK
jgi:hypothetical protein